MHRFYIAPEHFSGHEFLTEDPNLVHQLLKVLRAKVGEQFILFDGSGQEYLAELCLLNNKTVRFKIQKTKKCEAELPFKITLYQALPKSQERFEWLIEKATELGVNKIVPIITQRTERQSFSKRTRIERIIIEATEQSGRAKLLELSDPVSFRESLNHNCDLALLAYEKADEPNLKEISFYDSNFEGCVGIWIGPEGGFTDEEIVQARGCGITTFTLGKRILRMETAALAIVSALLW